jgi:DNA-binding LacI/PurR family transcriptional regulator
LRVTSTDVARRAGVSRATVSYVLNDAPDQSISDDTREAVRRAARELGYRPNSNARSLRSGRSDIVLFPLQDIEMRTALGDIIDRCAAALLPHRLTLVTDFTSYGAVEDRIDAWLRLRPAAVVDLILPSGDPTRDELQRAGIGVVSIAGPKPGNGRTPLDAVIDRVRETQLSYLLDAGHRRIVVALPQRAHDAQFGAGKRAAVHRAAKKAGATLEIEDVELEKESMRAAVARWRSAKPRPQAICAYNDEFAVGLLDACTELGVRVPKDLAIIGVDDIPLASVVSPSLTTVGYPRDAIARTVADAITSLIETDASEAEFPLPALDVIVRESA